MRLMREAYEMQLQDSTRRLKMTREKIKRTIDLNDKVNEFINWYFENMVKGNYTSVGEYRQSMAMRNFIEKMAVWYEFKYPNDEVTKLIDNPNNIEDNSDTRSKEKNKFYNIKEFMESLSANEITLFKNPRPSNLIRMDSDYQRVRLYLTPEGIVKSSEGIATYTHFKIKDKDLQGKHINEVIQIFHEQRVVLPSKNTLEIAAEQVEKEMYQKEEMLNCVMYRIIERGENRIGPRRAFLFAKEFGRNIDIPMMYGVDYSDPELRKFMNEYLKSGGSKDLVCYVDYFSRTSKNTYIDTITIQELIQLTMDENTQKEAMQQQESEKSKRGKVKQLK